MKQFFSRITNKSCICFSKELRHCFQTHPNCYYFATVRIQVVFGSRNCSVSSRSNLAKSLHQKVYFFLPSLQIQTCTGLPWLQGNPAPPHCLNFHFTEASARIMPSLSQEDKERNGRLTGVTSELNLLNLHWVTYKTSPVTTDCADYNFCEVLKLRCFHLLTDNIHTVAGI